MRRLLPVRRRSSRFAIVRPSPAFLPSLDTLRDLALNVVFGWKQLLTVSVPVSGFDHLFGMPYLVALVRPPCWRSAWRLRTCQPGPAADAARRCCCWSSRSRSASPQGLLPALVGARLRSPGARGWAAWRRSVRQAASLLSRAGWTASRATCVRDGGSLGTAACWPPAWCSAVVGHGAAGARWDRTGAARRDHPATGTARLRQPADVVPQVRRGRREGQCGAVQGRPALPRGERSGWPRWTCTTAWSTRSPAAGGAGSGLPPGRSQHRPAEPRATGDRRVRDRRADAGCGCRTPATSGVDFAGRCGPSELRSGLHYNAATGTALQTAGLPGRRQLHLHAAIAAQPSDEQLADGHSQHVDRARARR